jgi:hypothetical protein
MMTGRSAGKSHRHVDSISKQDKIHRQTTYRVNKYCFVGNEGRITLKYGTIHEVSGRIYDKDSCYGMVEL